MISNRVVTCQPFSISESDADVGARFGGTSPKGVHPPKASDRCEYLLTVSCNDRELSVFTALVYDPDDPNCVWRLSRQLLPDSNSWVQAVLHDPAPRSAGNRLRSSFAGHRLDVEDPRADTDEGPDGPYLLHKIGGTPVFRDGGKDLEALATSVMRDGFLHALQLASPGSRDADIGGSWPFGDDVFHVFMQRQSSRTSFRFLWG